MAMIGATVLEPGIYFAMNSPAGLIGTTAANAAQVISGWGFSVTPDMISQMAQDVGEKTLLSRAGGAPTLAVGMASILSGMFGGRTIGVPSVSRDSGMSLSVSGVDGASDRHFARPSEPVAATVPVVWTASGEE
jgi:hypothetical protein